MVLITYLSIYLGNLTTRLGISETDLGFIATETLRIYGCDTEAEATDLTKLYKIAKMECWKFIMLQQTANFDVSSDGQSYKSSQMYEFAKQNYFDAYTEAMPYLDDYEIKVTQHKIGGRKHHDEFSHHFC